VLQQRYLMQAPITHMQASAATTHLVSAHANEGCKTALQIVPSHTSVLCPFALPKIWRMAIDEIEKKHMEALADIIVQPATVHTHNQPGPLELCCLLMQVVSPPFGPWCGGTACKTSNSATHFEMEDICTCGRQASGCDLCT
jgi:hypothetical protein